MIPAIAPISSANNFLSKFQVGLPSAIADLASSMHSSTLPQHFEVGEYDVVCGSRGKGSYNKPGNKRFRAIVAQHVTDYTTAKTKIDKSTVLNSIVDQVRSQNNGQARFVALRDGQWNEISKEQVHEKAGHAMREAVAALDTADDTPRGPATV